eukprot:9976529-Alexandrium_andersonii.AAC.1
MVACGSACLPGASSASAYSRAAVPPLGAAPRPAQPLHPPGRPPVGVRAQVLPFESAPRSG